MSAGMVFMAVASGVERFRSGCGKRPPDSAIVMRSIWDFKINKEVAMEQCSKTWQMAAKRHM